MLVKGILLALTLILLVNEHFKYLDNINAKYRRTGLIIIFGLITMLSLIDLYNDKEDFDRLEKKSIEIFDKSEEVLGRVNVAVDGIDVSSYKLKTIDSLAYQTNKRLDTAITKSKELARIEANRFFSERPNILIDGGVIVELDSLENIQNLHIYLGNSGKRSATEVKFHSRAIFYDADKKVLAFIEPQKPNQNLKFYDYIDISPNTRIKSEFTPRININRFRDKLDSIILLISIIYKDEYTGTYKQTLVRRGNLSSNDKLVFTGILTDGQKILISELYEANGYKDYLFLD